MSLAILILSKRNPIINLEKTLQFASEQSLPTWRLCQFEWLSSLLRAHCPETEKRNRILKSVIIPTLIEKGFVELCPKYWEVASIQTGYARDNYVVFPKNVPKSEFKYLGDAFRHEPESNAEVERIGSKVILLNTQWKEVITQHYNENGSEVLTKELSVNSLQLHFRGQDWSLVQPQSYPVNHDSYDQSYVGDATINGVTVCTTFYPRHWAYPEDKFALFCEQLLHRIGDYRLISPFGFRNFMKPNEGKDKHFGAFKWIRMIKDCGDELFPRSSQ